MKKLEESMSLKTPSGSKVIHHTVNAGYDVDKINVKGHLTLKEEYTVDELVVGDWESTVYLEEFPRVPFNTVFFKNKVYNFEIQVKGPNDKKFRIVDSRDSISEGIDAAVAYPKKDQEIVRVYSRRSKRVMYE